MTPESLRHSPGRLALAVALLLTACVSAEPAVTGALQLVTSTTDPRLPPSSTDDVIGVPTTIAGTFAAPVEAPVEAVGRCRPSPFGDDVAGHLAELFPGQQLTAHVYDTRTGCEYELNPANRQSTASVFKVLVLAGTLLEAQNQGRDLTVWELSQLQPMITESANSPVRILWRWYGGSPWFQDQAIAFGLAETTVTADGGSAWGLTKTSARDQVNLIRQLLLGEWGPLSEMYRRHAVDLMSAVVPSQTWGVTAGAPGSWSVAQKNGFAGITINSVGWVDEPGESNGYVVAILSTGWPTHAMGIAAVELVSERVAAAMIDRVAGAQ